MQLLYTLAAVLLGALSMAQAQPPAEEEAERERRARALLAITTTKHKCAPSIESARKEAIKSDKVMVVMVGKTVAGCDTAADAGAVAVKVAEYTADKPADPTAPRLLVLSKGSGSTADPDTESLYIREVLPADAKPDAVKKVVEKVRAVSKSAGVKRSD